jgi:hypothetical protein
MPRERSFLLEECCRFLGAGGLATRLGFKYDEFSRNFGNYLPTLQNKFAFAVVMRTRRQVVLGVVATGVGRDSRAFAFNLSSGRVLQRAAKSRLAAGCSFESSMLKFGNEEIILKNNSAPEVRVNTMVIGEKYFEFAREDLFGKEESDNTVVLEAI